MHGVLSLIVNPISTTTFQDAHLAEALSCFRVEDIKIGQGKNEAGGGNN